MRCLLISSGLLFSSLAFADRKDDAKAELDRGIQRIGQKDFAGAIAAFEAGYALDPQPVFLYDKAQAQRMSGDCKAAIQTYKAFIAAGPPQSDVKRARKNIDQCEAQLAAARPEPAPAPEPAPSPAPTPAADDEPAPLSSSGETSDVAVTSETPERAGFFRDKLGVGLLTVGGIGIGIGIGYAVAAQSAAQETSLVVNNEQWNEANDRWKRDSMIAKIAAGAGATFVLGGMLRLVLRDRTVAVTAPSSGSGAVMSIGGAW